MEIIIIRYSELGLKGKNRHWFENLLMGNVKKHLSAIQDVKISKIHGRVILRVESVTTEVTNILRYIPGIANFSPGVIASHELSEISRQAIALVQEYAENSGESMNQTFKVSARRSEKSFPLNSQQLGQKIGSDILDQFPDLKVNLTAPQMEVGIEIWPNDQAVLFLEKIPGQGGLPAGSAGNVISFLSGGIDSPVASWMMMKRGCAVTYIHFHSFPFIGEQSRQKVIDLVTHLSRFQPVSNLIIIPFAELQKAVQLSCQEKNRTVLYRRLMYHIANKLKAKVKALAYVTGEAVGQVASQTLENISCTEDASSLPVLRPLIGKDKAEIIELAKQIGTYEISVQPFPDCCTVFQPRKPEIHGKVTEMRIDETKLDLEPLIEDAVEKAEILTVKTQVQEKFWD